MNDTKRKIQEMMKKEAVAKRREELEESRFQKTGQQKKVKVKDQSHKKERVPMDADKKKLMRNLFFISLFFLMAFGLFYGASVVKKEVETNYQLKLQTDAEKELQS